MNEKVFLDTKRNLLVYTRSNKYSLRLKIDYGLQFLLVCAEYKRSSEWVGMDSMSASEYFKVYPT